MQAGHAGAPARESRRLSWVLLLLLAPLAAGAFLPGPNTWGFSALAYLPRLCFGFWCAGAVAALWLALRPSEAVQMGGATSRFLLNRRAGAVALALVGGVLFVLLRSRSFYLGDGPLMRELAEKGVPFHGFDDLHYALCAWVYRLGLRRGEISPYAPFQAASVIAGGLGIFLAVSLVRRLGWEAGRKVLVLCWLLCSGPIALYFGYVEVYSFLLALLTAFFLAGLLVLEGRAPLWWAGALFACAMLFQLTAVFSAPALLVLLLRAPEPSWRRRWIALALPSIAVGVLWIMIHLVLGMDQGWFRRGFLENEHARTLFLPLSGGHGLVSLSHWKDMLNLALITVPVPLAVLLFNLRPLAARRREPAIQFLLAQVITLLVCNLILDRKLGTARDWDLLAAQASGAVILAAMLWPRGDTGGEATAAALRGLAAALVVSFLMTAPWVLLVHRDQDSARWLADAALDFGDPAQPYAYEELGKHHRMLGDYERAEEMYRRCVQAGPDNPRFHVVLGTTYAVRGKIELARSEYAIARRGYEAALRAHPDDISAKRRLAQILAWQGEAASAAGLYLELTRDLPKDASLWMALGQAALTAEQPELAARALGQAKAINPSLPVDHDLGVAWIGLNRWEEAASAFRRALRQGEDPSVRLGLAGALVSLAEERLHAGEPPSLKDLTEAEENLRAILQSNAQDPDARELLRRAQLLRQGGEPEPENQRSSGPPGR